MNIKSARAKAFANLALVKYFGKRDLALNLPAAGSLSLTLEPLTTNTEVTFSPEFTDDSVVLGGTSAKEAFRARVSKFLDIVRQMAGCNDFARVTTTNDFPTAAGLASSASGFAALALASTQALGLNLNESNLSALARRGSGSAARSIPGGITVWQRGDDPDGSDSLAQTIANPNDWDLRVVVGVTDPAQKPIGSTEAMERTRQTSPYYDNWISSTELDLKEAITAVESRNFTSLGEIAEHSALKMHAAAFAAKPGIIFWKGATLDALHATRNLRESGTEAYFTCDAGPQPKVLCLPTDQDKVIQSLSQLPGIVDIICCTLGTGACLV